MIRISHKLKYAVIALAMVSMVSCKDDDVVPPVVEKPLRAKVDYATLTPTTPYAATFVDADKKSTVDFTYGNNRYKMFQAINVYIASSISANKEIDAAVLKGMFNNTGNRFADSTKLNTSGIQLRDKVASSWTEADGEPVRKYIETLFDEVALASKSITTVGSAGKPGKVGTFLVNAQGVEPIQLIQKSLIGALHYDYIASVLLTKGLEADNKKVVTGKNYTQLEQNWDEAYGFLTLSPIYLLGSTKDKRATTEFGLGAYTWEYNKDDYPKMYSAFLKGRAAIVNNDMAELKVQADFIKKAFEKAIAKSSVGYLGKAITATSPDAQIHPMSEGLGFIYSLRFLKITGGDATFSNARIAEVMSSPKGVWELSVTKLTAASDAIKAKFNVQ